MQLFH